MWLQALHRSASVGRFTAPVDIPALHVATGAALTPIAIVTLYIMYVTSCTVFMQSARIDNGTWLSISENFILYWKYQHTVYWTESLRYNLFLDSELIAVLDATVCSIKGLHHVKIQCDSDGSTYDAYVSCLINAASQYDSAPFTMTEMEIIQSTPILLEPVLSDIDSQTDLFDFCFGDSMAQGESQLTVSIDVTIRCVGPSFCEYKQFLPL